MLTRLIRRLLASELGKPSSLEVFNPQPDRRTAAQPRRRYRTSDRRDPPQAEHQR